MRFFPPVSLAIQCLLFLYFSAAVPAQMMGQGDLVPAPTATHVATASGDWFVPQTWGDAGVPSDAAIVHIPTGITVTYADRSEVHLFAIRVDGTLEVSQPVAGDTTKLIFDTFFGTMGSVIRFDADAPTDGTIVALIKPFDIQAHKAGSSGYPQNWNSAAMTHFSDGAAVEMVEYTITGDRRYNTFAEAQAGDTGVTESSLGAYDDGPGVTGRYGWDPGQVSLGLMTMGQIEIIGQEKLVMSKLAADALRSQKDVQLSDVPTGWKSGDQLLVSKSGNNISGTNNEVRTIDVLSGTTVTTTSNLGRDHPGRPEYDLHCYAGNLTRNIIFRSAEKDQIHQRGHLMAMFNNTNTQIRNAAFIDMGRTDKSRMLDDDVFLQWRETSIFKSKYSSLGQEVVELQRPVLSKITNSRGRYPIHLHKTGAKVTDNLVHVTGNVVWGSPGWGITHHDSYANVSNNVVYEVNGAGIVSETGSELGSWENNLIVEIDRADSRDVYIANTFFDDHSYRGLGMALKGRGVFCRGNVIVSASEGVGVMNMGASINHTDRMDAEALATFRDGHLQFPLDRNGYSSEGDGVMPGEVALIMENTTVIASNQGLRSIEREMGVNHESRSIFDGFICWGIKQGFSITYQADYSFRDVFISGDGSSGSLGMFVWKHSHNHLFENVKLVDLDFGIQVSKLVESGNGELKTRNNGQTPWVFIDLELENVGKLYEVKKEDEATATEYTEHSDNPIHLSSSELVPRDLSFTILDSSEMYVDYATGDFRFEVDGIIADDAGTYRMGIKQAEAQGTLRLDYPERIYEFASAQKFEEYLLNEGGVYEDEDGKLYFILTEFLPNRRTYEYTGFPIRIEIRNAPASGVFVSPQSEVIEPTRQLVSRRATATQSSTETNVSYDGNPIDASAWKSIDDNNNGRINCQIFQRGLLPLGSFSQTQVEADPWFDLKLVGPTLIDYIDVWNTVELRGEDIEENSTGFQDFYVLISNKPFGDVSLAEARGTALFEYYVGDATGARSGTRRKESFNDLNVVGQYVRIQGEGMRALKLAEVEVVGTPQELQLPVSLMAFTAEPDPQSKELISILNWKVAEEVDFSHYEIEHATGPANFTSIGRLPATGSSLYAYHHLEPVVGDNYYRLRMVDLDGTEDLSPVRHVEFGGANALRVFPNPNGGRFNVWLSEEVPDRAGTLRIIDVAGRIVHQQQVSGSTAEVLTEGLAAGVYTVNLGFAERTLRRRIVIR